MLARQTLNRNEISSACHSGTLALLLVSSWDGCCGYIWYAIVDSLVSAAYSVWKFTTSVQCCLDHSHIYFVFPDLCVCYQLAHQWLLYARISMYCNAITQYMPLRVRCIGMYCGMYCGMYWWYVLSTYQHVFNTNWYVFNTYLPVLVCVVLVLRTYWIVIRANTDSIHTPIHTIIHAKYIVHVLVCIAIRANIYQHVLACIALVFGMYEIMIRANTDQKAWPNQEQRQACVVISSSHYSWKT